MTEVFGRDLSCYPLKPHQGYKCRICYKVFDNEGEAASHCLDAHPLKVSDQ